MKKKFFLRHIPIFLIPLLIPLLIFSFFSTTLIQRYIIEDINKNNMNLLKQSKENVELIFNEMDLLSLIFDVNAKLVIKFKSILSSSELPLEDYYMLETLKNFIDAPANSKPYIKSIYIYYDNPRQRFINSIDGLSDIAGYFDTSWYESFLKKNSNVNVWTEMRSIQQYSFEKTPSTVISIYKRLYTPGMDQGKGVIVLNIFPQYIENLLNSLSTLPDQNILVLDENNQIVFNSGKTNNIKDINLELIRQNPLPFFVQKSPRASYVVSKLNSDKYAWNFVLITPLRTLYHLPLELNLATVLLVVLCLILGFGLAYYLSKRNYKQIQNIISIIDSAETGRPLPPLPSIIKDEYSYIIQNILKTFIEQSYLKVQLSERKYHLQAMELQMLQSQINPHFLYNTLDTINWKTIAITGKPNELTKMIQNLSNILKYSLSNPNERVTLKDEIENTLSYIEIQKIRYRNKFDVQLECEDDIKTQSIIKLIIQPLIENSIYHGIKEKPGKSCIKIKILSFNTYLSIAVVDNGLGIRDEKLRLIREKLELENEKSPSEHIGLYNINKRLKLAYGSQYSIKLNSKSGFGTAVYLYIPIA